jgi:hypothetical protein
MKKSIIITGIAVLVSGLCLAAVLWLTSEQPLPSPPPEFEIRKPVELTLEDVASIEFFPSIGAAYTLSLSPEDGDSIGISIFPTRTGFAYDGEIMLETAAAAVSLNGSRLLDAHDADDDSAYRFDDPLIVWTIAALNGEAYTLEMGGQSGGGDGMYIRMTGSPELYILPMPEARRIARSEAELRRLRFLPEYRDVNEALLSWDFIGVHGTNAPFALRLMSEDELDSAPVAALHRFVEPMQFYGEHHNISIELVTPILTLGFNAVVEDDPTDLQQYGLDDPYRLILRDARGWQAVLWIGNETERGGRYVMQQGIDTVFWDAAGDYSFLNINYVSMINRLFWVHNIQTVGKVEYRLGDVSHTVHYDVTEEEFSGIFDGVPLSETNGRRLYIHTLQLTLNDALPANTVPGLRFGVITITLRDGAEHVFELFPVGERSYNVHLNGEDLKSLVHKDSVERVLQGLETIRGGGNIEEL